MADMGQVQGAGLHGRRNGNPGVQKGGPQLLGTKGQRSPPRHRGLSAADSGAVRSERREDRVVHGQDLTTSLRRTLQPKI